MKREPVLINDPARCAKIIDLHHHHGLSTQILASRYGVNRKTISLILKRAIPVPVQAAPGLAAP